MPETFLVSVFCPDRVGLVAALAGRLFDLGADLGDTTFAVLGEAAEFNAVCDMDDGTEPEHVRDDLAALPELDGAEVSVTRFEMSPVHGPLGRITHRIVLSGGDRPGLIARLSEVFIQFGGNIVRLNAERVPDGHGGRYLVRIAASIPEEAAGSCLATVGNTAGELGLDCNWERATPGRDE